MISDTTLRRVLLGVGAVITTVGIAAAVHASTQNTADRQGPFMGRPGRMAMLGSPLGRLRAIAPRLGLSDAQKGQIKGIVQSHRDEWKALADRAASARNALSDAMKADTIDDNVIRQRSADVAAVRADMAVAFAHARTEIVQVLTPDQQAQLKTIESQMTPRLDQARERWRKRTGQG